MAHKTKEERGPLGWALLKAREALAPAKTQGEVAEALGISQATVCSWESSETKPRADRLDEIAAAYRIAPARLRSIWFAASSGQAAA